MLYFFAALHRISYLFNLSTKIRPKISEKGDFQGLIKKTIVNNLDF